MHWLLLQILIWVIPGSSLGPETGYPQLFHAVVP